MVRFSFGCAALLVALCTLTAAARADDCRKEFVVPYAEQCGYAYGSLKKDQSAANLSAAFAACGRAQDVAAPCVASKDRTLHGVATSALYRDVTQQAEIAMFAQQFAVAQALLREKLQVLDVAARDVKPHDATVARERAATKLDLKDAIAGECTVRATAGAGAQRALAHDRKYADLETLLKRKSQDYAGCAKLAASPAKRAYIEYEGLVAIEESGRAAQASGADNDSAELYAICVAGADHSQTYAAPAVRAYLKTVATLCAGRAKGTYRVDEPEPLDADPGKKFTPLRLPHS